MFFDRSSMMSLWALLLLLLCTQHGCDATIRVVDLETEYLSRPDKYVGLQMKTGIEYGARLQSIPGDPHLCGGQDFNVTVPDDGRPVALLVKKGLCSCAQKAEFASRHIHPAGIVKVLIIDGEIRIMDKQNDKNKDNFDRELVEEKHSELSSYEFPNYYNWHNNSNSIVTLRRRHANDISVTLLHVSYQTGNDLLNLVLNEYDSVKKDGGILVTVDSTAPPISQSIIMVWTAVCIILSMLACCCIANVMEDMYEAQQPEPEPPRRPRRQRLTPEQVQQMPIGIFDGHQLVYNDEENPIENSQEDAEQKPSTLCLQPAESALDACTICLDDYEIGDKLRCLPCGHAFHANCIAKWLIERSATCPLCNKDLYEEESDDEDEEDETMNPMEHPETIPSEDIETTAAAPEERSIRDPWWRNLFRRRREEIGEGLAEPLLQEQEEGLDGLRPGIGGMDEETSVVEEPETVAQDAPQDEETPEEPNSSD